MNTQGFRVAQKLANPHTYTNRDKGQGTSFTQESLN